MTMWISNTNPSTSRLYDEWMDEHVDDLVEDLPGEKRGVVFDGNIQVTKEVGEELINRYSTIEEYDKEES